MHWASPNPTAEQCVSKERRTRAGISGSGHAAPARQPKTPERFMPLSSSVSSPTLLSLSLSLYLCPQSPSKTRSPGFSNLMALPHPLLGRSLKECLSAIT